MKKYNELEIWKDAVGYEDFFMISNYGRVWSKRTNKEIKTNVGKTGYKSFVTKLGGRKSKSICLRIHRLVALAFVKNPEEKPFVNHMDGNKENNFYKNLEWCTQKENATHAYKKGLLVIHEGEDSCKAILSKKDVLEIKKLLSEKILKHREIADRYGVSRKTITSISTNQSWKSVQ